MFDLGSFDNIFATDTDLLNNQMGDTNTEQTSVCTVSVDEQNFANVNSNSKENDFASLVDEKVGLDLEDIENLESFFDDEFTLDTINVSTPYEMAIMEMYQAFEATNQPIIAHDQPLIRSMGSLKGERVFKTVTESELDDLQAKRQSKSTKNNTKWGVKLFQEWSVHNSGSEVDFTTITADDLCVKLRRFYAEAQPRNVEKRAAQMTELQANEYHKNSFKSIRAAINRHLNDLNRDIDIVRDKAFKSANQTLDGKLKQNVSDGSSRPTKHKDVISCADLEKINNYLYAETNPVTLRQRVWYNLSVHFVSRGLEFHPQLQKDSFEFLRDENNIEYVTLKHEVQQKNHQGGIDYTECAEKRMYATDGEKCPVKSLRDLLSRTVDDASSLFNHCVKDALKSPESCEMWYINKAVKPYQFSRFMGDISKSSGCSKMYTAHCLRATSIQAMNDAGHELRHIMLMSGHRNEASIRSYTRNCTDEQKRDLSNTLSKVISAQSLSSRPSATCVPSPSASTAPPSPLATLPIDESAFPLSTQSPHKSTPSVLNNQQTVYQGNHLNSSSFLSSGFLANSTFNNCHFHFHVSNN